MDVKQGTHQTGRHRETREPPSITHNDKDQLRAAITSQFIVSPSHNPLTVPDLPVETKHYITSHLVGIFHTWAKPRGGALVAVGDRVNVGQLVATIESLNVINEVESSFAGRVVEILVLEGQSVEYGQKLMIIDTSAESEGQ